MWKAVGGVEGLAELMATFSVREVTLLCQAIRKSATEKSVDTPRQKAITSLYDTLRGAGSTPNPDTRPLLAVWKQLIPACDAETSLTHTKDNGPDGKTCQVHPATYEKLALDELFRTQGKRKTVTAYKALFERSRDFAIHVLERFAEDPAAVKENKAVLLSDLIHPLLRRLEHNALKDGKQGHVYALLLECLKIEPSIVKGMVFEIHALIDLVVKRWNHQRSEAPQKKNQMLADLIGFLVPDTYDLKSIHRILLLVRPAARYELLRLVLQNTQRYRFDIDSEDLDTNKKIKEIKGHWPIELFMDIETGAALRLLRKLIKIHPDGIFLRELSDNTTSIIKAKSPAENHPDTDIVVTYLSASLPRNGHDDIVWISQAEKTISERQKQAAASREWEDRAKWADSALKLSIATGSLDTYAKTLQWARRYNRDAQTVKVLYSHNSLSTDEGVNLLSGLPSEARRGPFVTLDEVPEAVLKANKIILQLFETSGMAIQEPSFSSYDWNSLLSLPHQVVERRSELARNLQEKHKIPDEVIFKTIWKPTIEMLLEVERFSLKEEHERLEFDDVEGPLKDLTLKSHSPTTFQFLDILARERNELWTAYRPTIHPATTALAKPWPRGLPIRYLYPQYAPTHDIHLMPYLLSRAQEVIFADSTTLSPPPSDQEIQDAIGPFVESYRCALKIYLSGTKGGDRDARIELAWRHATTVLTGDLMSGDEAAVFWKSNVFASADPDLRNDLERLGLAPKPRQIPVELPAITVDEAPIEWNPFQDQLASQGNVRTLPETCLDPMLSEVYGWGRTTVKTAYSPQTSTTLAVSPPGLWAKQDDIPRQRSTTEALAAAGIAYLNTCFGSDTALLLAPYPSPADIRFPALYLDQDVLDSLNKLAFQPLTIQEVLCFMDKNLAALPLPLLIRLSNSLLLRLTNSPQPDPKVHEILMKLVKYLTQSDRPAVGCQFVQQIVVHRQDDSSWHRSLFNAGFLRRLTATDAKAFFVGLSSEIQKMMQNSPANAKEPVTGIKADVAESAETTQLPEDDKKKPNKGFVKISTIKMVPQMLREANYIDRQSACDILIAILNSSQHPDVQFSITESLFEMLHETQDPALREILYTTIEKHIVPIAASINERTPPSEQDWLAAESGKGPLPELYNDLTTLPPILNFIASKNAAWKYDSSEQHEWSTRVIIPAAKGSAASFARWLSIFGRRNRFELPAGYLPEVPLQPHLLHLTMWNRIPESFTRENFETIKRYALVNFQPSASLAAANKSIKENGDLLKSDAGKHWLRVWDNAGNGAFAQGFNQFAESLRSLKPESPEAQEVPIQEFQEFFLRLGTDIIEKSNILMFDNIMRLLHIVSPNKKDIWLSNNLPVMRHFVAKIKELRTEAWRRDPRRTPSALPRGFGVQQLMLKSTYEVFITGTEPTSEDYASFANDVSSMIDELTFNGSPYHNEWRSFPSTVCGVYPPVWRLKAGVSLASKVNAAAPQLADHLKVELVDSLIQSANPQKKGGEAEEECKRATDLLVAWLDSPSEVIWTMAKSRAQQLEAARLKGDGWLSKDLSALL
ncbi:hypothetical protein BX600DRAFT_465186 [Xylariales sp. PMI_506]|nr:hypothetical protein BX600DRAFT_465186 [Xylariales sp. PMI_506]